MTYTILTFLRSVGKPSDEDMANRLLKLAKRNKNDNRIKFYESWILARKKFRNLGRLERQISPPLEAYKQDRDKITKSNKSFGLLFE